MTCPASSTLHAATITPCTDPDVNLTIIWQLSTVISVCVLIADFSRYAQRDTDRESKVH